MLLIAARLAACDNPIPADAPQSPTPTEFVEETEDPDVIIHEPEEAPKATADSVSGIDKLEIPSFPSKEEDFIENLDTGVLERIASEIQSLVAEIGEKERADPNFVLQGKWNEYFRSSEQYKLVLELGLKAVKPAYYIIYKSPQSGLYEYILASAIDKITGYDYAVMEDYGWSSSKQFLEMYNEKVKQTLKSFRAILDNSTQIEAEKAEQIRALGIFAVGPLLDEIDSSSPSMPVESLKATLWHIIKEYSAEDLNQNLDSWRSENEETYRDIIEILD